MRNCCFALFVTAFVLAEAVPLRRGAAVRARRCFLAYPVRDDSASLSRVVALRSVATSIETC